MTARTVLRDGLTMLLVVVAVMWARHAGMGAPFWQDAGQAVLLGVAWARVEERSQPKRVRR